MKSRSKWLPVLAGSTLIGAVLFGALALGSGRFARVQAETGGCPAPPATATPTATPAAFAVTIPGPCSGNTGQPITFTAVISNGGASIADLQYFWNFGDSSPVASGNPLPHTYTTAGTFTVSVAVQGNGRSATTTTTAVIALALPISANGPYTGNIGQAIAFNATISGTAPTDLAYVWDFGDGSPTSAQVQPSHIYNTTGVFNVTLTAASASAGRTGMDKTTATIGAATPAPTATASAGPTTSPTPAPTATGPTFTYQPGWNLVGGATGQTFPGASGPLYSYPPGATVYGQLPQGSPIVACQGYWAFFPAKATVPIAVNSQASCTVNAPAGEYFILGNPSQTDALTVRGADFVYPYDPTAGQYGASSVLAPGQGAWVFSANGGQVTLSK